MEHVGGFPALRSYMKDTLTQFQFASWQGAVYDPVGQGFNLFDRVVYSKGAWVLHMLRGILGDSLFFQSLGVYRAGFAEKSVITSEFQEVVDSVAGMNTDWFFNQWIFSPGWPRIATGWTWSADTLEYTVNQLPLGGWPVYRLPVTIRAYTPGTFTDFRVVDSMDVQTFRLPLTQMPDSVILDPDYWVLKQFVPPPLSVGEWGRTPLRFSLDQNYPNPFNPMTNIEFRIAKFGFVTLKVYDLLGQQVATLANEKMNPGSYNVAWNATESASGVYLYRLTAGNFTETKRMLLLK